VKAGVVGAGILGQLLALKLVDAGWNVTLFEQHTTTAHSCSMAAAGLLTPISELDKCNVIIFQLGQAALNTHWPKILSQLPKPIYFQASGSLAVAHPHDRADLTHFIQRIAHQLNNPLHYEACTQTDIQRLEPELEKFSEGYYFPNEGQIDNQQLLKVLEKHLLEEGVEWQRATTVKTIKPHQIILENTTHMFDSVFDCRGLGAKTIFKNLRGIRGELIWLHANDVHISRPIRFLHPRYSLYIAPRPESIYLVGASEIESEDTSPISVKTTLELLTAVYYLHPGFSEARVLQSTTQCRPTLSDHLPKIKFSEGLVAVNGLYRHGYLIAPTLVHDILQYMHHGIGAVDYPTLWEKHDDYDSN
jgi:glycine oxidase